MHQLVSRPPCGDARHAKKPPAGWAEGLQFTPGDLPGLARQD